MVAVVSFIFGVIEVLLGFRFLFLLFGANPLVPFVNWIYEVSFIFVAPFVGIFGQPGTDLIPGGVVNSVFDLTTLVALLVYAAVGGLLVSLFTFTRRSTQINIS